MSLVDYFTRKPEFDILAMEEADCQPAAVLHRQRFAAPWSDGDLHGLIVQAPVFGLVARQSNAIVKGVTGGFVLSRAVLDEAEILTICVDPRYARTGLGWRLMQGAQREALSRGAASMFLEVDEANVAALALYRKLGFEKVGERRGYYQDATGRRTAALVMRRDLR
ncbi:ribosomal-protein-alanine N-acetyltransferase [Rhizobium sp. RU20A]|uniref:GNAT family N-acetyltransferase n=1 Tax=Rhizobium sp. RU20A TaxID=1907412 RepID=UPI000956C6D3|nr:GNAT family N-acetyltransferase [Rhizobium sp. RU20A]SIQ70451.1 ribosomal-protein-alanine N-acetyltransferase [Rhizobium sp. RU20A]